jgi:hypothetical protein
LVRAGIDHHLHTCCNDLHQRDLSRYLCLIHTHTTPVLLSQQLYWKQLKILSAQSAGGVGIANVVHRMERHQYMGFENLCKYGA